MLTIQQNVDLNALNTFGMSVRAPFFSVLHTEADCTYIEEAKPEGMPILLLGGGSNILFTRSPEAWVLRNEIKGISLLRTDETSVWVKVGAGVVWHDFVCYCVAQGYAGVENLSLIPGTVGAAPIQNIGAYGVEVKQVIDTVTYWDLQEYSWHTLDRDACRFGYRDSIFKHELKGRALITHVVFRLSVVPAYQIGYGTIKDELQRQGVQELSLQAVADAVIHIRQSKLPDPKQIGNAGSFFKNPEVPLAVYERLKAQHTDMPAYVVSEQIMKIPAAWLIERCGWKGYREGNYGVHQHQALVLVNYGQASGTDIYQLSGKIIRSVTDTFGIVLEREVQIV